MTNAADEAEKISLRDRDMLVWQKVKANPEFFERI
jgi:hypothetical protein